MSLPTTNLQVNGYSPMFTRGFIAAEHLSRGNPHNSLGSACRTGQVCLALHAAARGTWGNPRLRGHPAAETACAYRDRRLTASIAVRRGNPRTL